MHIGTSPRVQRSPSGSRARIRITGRGRRRRRNGIHRTTTHRRDRATSCVVAERVQPDMDTPPLLVLAADEAEALRATGGLPFPSVAVVSDQDGTILLIARWAGLPPR